MTNELTDLKKCPFCAEDIKAAAIVCKHCKRDLPNPTTGLTVAKPADPLDPKLYGRCAHCDGVLLLSEETCPHCKANYGVHSAAKQPSIDHSMGRDAGQAQNIEKPKKFKWWLWIPLGLLGIFIMFAIMGSNDPEIQAKMQARDAIDFCWTEQKRKSLDAHAQRLMAEVCEFKENQFFDRFKTRP